jgi:chemotaxis protein CheY-P-specific phosphatase CheC
MVNGNHGVANQSLESVFQLGFANAAQSFALMTNKKALFNNFHHGHLDFSAPVLDETYQQYNQKPRILITTEVFGDVIGKSYLFLSEKDYELLTHSIPNGVSNLKEEFTKELDNILSAAVITKLSNQLKKKMYGDVPVMIGRVTSRLEDTICDDFVEQADGVYINSVFFSFENQPEVCPLFVWVFEKSLVDQYKENALV